MEIIDAYTAGLIDGEGTITMSRNKSTDKFRHPVVSMSSTTYGLLQFLKDNYGGVICKQKTYNVKHKQAWSWRITHNTAIDCLLRVEKYLLEPEKKRRSIIITKVYKNITHRNGKYNNEEIRIKKDFENNFLNR